MYILYDRDFCTQELCAELLYMQQCMHVDRIMIMQAGMPACMQYYRDLFILMSAFCASSCLEAHVFYSLPVCHGTE